MGAKKISQQELVVRRRRWFAWLVVSAVVGILASFYLLFIHLVEESSVDLCTVSSFINCDVVHFRDYSEVLGIPVPIFSILFYGVVWAAAWMGRRQKTDATIRPALYLWFMALLSLLSTFYMAFVSLFVLDMLCPFCSVLYVVSFVFAYFAWRLYRSWAQPWGHLLAYDFRRFYTRSWFWWVTGISVVVLVGCRLWLGGPAQLSAVAHSISDEDLRTLGKKDAPVVFTVFSDFQCPYCSVASKMLKMVQARMPDTIRVVYKFFPLDRKCNRLGGGHPFSCLAARATYCASLQGEFWPYHDLIYAERRNLSEAKIFGFVIVLGLEAEKFDVCLKSEEPLKSIEKDIEEGITLQLRGTPTIFINGQKFNDRFSVDGLMEAARNAQ